MPWPSKDPDDYLERPLLDVPSPGVERPRPRQDELAPQDWKYAAPTTAAHVVVVLVALVLILGGGALAGAGVFEGERWIYLLAGLGSLVHFIGRRVAGASLRDGRRWPDPRTAPWGAAPWGASVGLVVGMALFAAAVARAFTDAPRDRALVFYVGLLLLAPAAAWALDWFVGRPERRSGQEPSAIAPTTRA